MSRKEISENVKRTLMWINLKIEKCLYTFVNSVVLYDDRIDFYFNFKDNAKSLTLSELNTVSDLLSSSPPCRHKLHIACGDFLYP